jgi:hypothetical protein
MQRIDEMKICWTKNISNHLHMTNDGYKVVSMFHHALFLRCQRGNATFLPDLVKKRLRTFALISWKYRIQTKKRLQALSTSLVVD